MYKKIILIAALFCISSQYASDIRPWIEAKPSYFLFYDSPAKDVYNHGGFQIQVSGSVPLCNYFDLYSSIGYRHIAGHALNTREKTSLGAIPFDIGVKPVFNCGERVYYFFAVGPRFFHFEQKNKSPYIDRIVKGGGVGLFLNTGLNVLCTKSFLFGFFGEYSYEKKRICPKRPNVFSDGSVQFGGFAFGVSLGYAF